MVFCIADPGLQQDPGFSSLLFVQVVLRSLQELYIMKAWIIHDERLPRFAAATKCVDLLFLLFQDGCQQNALIVKLIVMFTAAALKWYVKRTETLHLHRLFMKPEVDCTSAQIFVGSSQ